MAVTDPVKRDELATKWVAIAVKMSWKLAAHYRMDLDETFEAALFGITLALNTYEGQCSFGAFVVNRIKMQVSKRKRNLCTKKNTTVTYDDPTKYHMDREDIHDPIESMDILDEVELVKSCITTRQWEALYCRHILGMSVRETGERIGVSEAGVDYLYARALKKSRELLGSRCSE